MRTRTLRAGAALALSAAVVGMAVVVVRASNGSYSGRYEVTGYFQGTGQGLYPGSDVDYRGVAVGTVKSISLAGYATKVKMAISPGFHIPISGQAVIQPKNVFGTEDVALGFPAANAGPYVPPGGTLRNTSTSPEIGNLLSSADPLLKNLNASALSNVILQLAEASDGEGPAIAAGWQDGSKAAEVLAGTINQQITALQAFNRFSAAIAGTGPLWNQLAADANQALPVLNAAQPTYDRLLKTLTPLSNDIASLVFDYTPDIQTMLADGDNVDRVLLANIPEIENLVTGLYEYLYKIGNGVGAETLTDGTKFAYFQTFLLFSDVNSLVCSLLAPAQAEQAAPGGAQGSLAYLAPLEEAISQAGTALDCGAAPPFGAAMSGAASTPATSEALSSLSQQVYRILGAPQGPSGSGSGTGGNGGGPEGGSSGGQSSSQGGSGLGQILQSVLGGGG